MSQMSDTRRWVASLAPRTFFTPADAPPATRASIDSALSRLAGADGPILRVKAGLYWVRPAQSRFGPSRPDPLSVALAASGPGAGPSGPSAVNALGLSTQVPFTDHVAVIGRPPKGVDRVRFTTRTNYARRDLKPLEVAVLEALRVDRAMIELSWPDAVARLRDLAAHGQIDLAKIVAVGRMEHNARVRERLPDLVVAV